MLDTITTADLKIFMSNHRENKNLGIETDSAAIELGQLQTFINQAIASLGSDFNAVKIYFVRYPLDADQDHIKKASGKDLSQVSLALVPAKVIDPDAWTVKPLPLDGDKFTLFVCAPTTPSRTHDGRTGLCQPKCDGDGE